MILGIFRKLTVSFINIFISKGEPWQMCQNKIQIAAIQMIELIELVPSITNLVDLMHIVMIQEIIKLICYEFNKLLTHT